MLPRLAVLRGLRPRAKRSVAARHRRLFVESLEDRRVLAAAFPEFLDPNPAAGNNFGAAVVPLSTGNVVISSPGDDAGGIDAGAVYLFNGETGALISSLTGGTAGDEVGSSVTGLASGNFVVHSKKWDNGAAVDAGAVTFGNGTTGISGVVSPANSLVGSAADDSQFSSVTALPNGNYVVRNPAWDNGTINYAGAATFGSGTTGISGTITPTNSLVGTSAGDGIGDNGISVLKNGNYVVESSSWKNGAAPSAGAVTFGSGTTGVSGVVSATNSLVGSAAFDGVGGNDVIALTNGNYVVRSPQWDNAGVSNAGAATWGDGMTGVSGTISVVNSLVGTTAGDNVGSDGIRALTNGNYVVRSPLWNNGGLSNVGAATFGNGTTGIQGAISPLNSLVGSQAEDNVGNYGVIALASGNYVVQSIYWNNDAIQDAGAVTFGSGATGISGVVTLANSFGGTKTDEYVGLDVETFSSGAYAIVNPYWNNGAQAAAGAVTFASGTTGISGVATAGNSLVGTRTIDYVGDGGVTELANGNYVVISPYWDNGGAVNAGAVTFVDAATGLVGPVSESNSLVGTQTEDFAGSYGVKALKNGNYVVRSSEWANGPAANAGAVTFASGTAGISGPITAANSLVGGTASNFVGSDGITELPNGNYLVGSSDWNTGSIVDAGAVTFANGTTGISGVVSAANSLVGSAFEDFVGLDGITALPNGNYLVRSSAWDNGTIVDAGTVTFADGTTGISGAVSSANSLVGSTAGDSVGSNSVNVLDTGNYAVRSALLGQRSGRQCRSSHLRQRN